VSLHYRDDRKYPLKKERKLNQAEASDGGLTEDHRSTPRRPGAPNRLCCRRDFDRNFDTTGSRRGAMQAITSSPRNHIHMISMKK
jgi:hypothetical protein